MFMYEFRGEKCQNCEILTKKCEIEHHFEFRNKVEKL